MNTMNNSRFTILAKAIVLAVVMISCSGHPSVHRFYVEHENSEGFSSFIIPSNIISFKDGADVDEETLEAVNDLNSLYILRYSLDEDPTASGENYYEELRSCIRNGYQEMMSMTTSDQEIKVVISEDAGEISEIVALIREDGGFTMARITGKIELDELMKIANKIDLNKLMTETNMVESLI